MGRVSASFGNLDDWRTTDRPDWEFDLVDRRSDPIVSGFGYGHLARDALELLAGSYAELQPSEIATFEYETDRRVALCCEPCLVLTAVNAVKGGHVEQWLSHGFSVNGPDDWSTRHVDDFGNTTALKTVISEPHEAAFRVGGPVTDTTYFAPLNTGPGRSLWAAMMVPVSMTDDHVTWQGSIDAHRQWVGKDPKSRNPWRLVTAQPVAYLS